MAPPRAARSAGVAAEVAAFLVAWLLASGAMVADAARTLKTGNASPPSSPLPPPAPAKNTPPAASDDGSSGRVKVQAPYVNVDVNTNSGSGCVVIPGIGRL
ncbi:hypothetical protein HXX76_012918 [Chlamydomonas incerta]|uniref:Uncharacterized protein n=1 Tax=Chlamydomonas incerta TaxID=51695 RepID=A0A835SKE0_CHLIN|nr:hypothetical protein HXX76_012918 [Chlamydomonas incerta]|eukprot:KAG2426602.1 hypothetical protein HXX76_012918 [Chlamydomonas incerta]